MREMEKKNNEQGPIYFNQTTSTATDNDCTCN